LVSEAKAFFAQKGIHYYTVYTAAGNRAALDFYASQGMDPLYVTMLGEL
jgi:hypothetical protein